MRKINKHIIHCSATPNGKNFTASSIKKMHIDKGWRDIGYHYVIETDGTIRYGRPVQEQGAHVKGHNEDSIGTCLIGTDKFSVEQIASLIKLNQDIKHAFGENIEVYGHNDFTDKKECPCFNVKDLFNPIEQIII